MKSEAHPQVKSCGFLILRGSPVQQFLLMRHPDRWDLPKGHVDSGESDLECALRELQEETSISKDDIVLDPAFRFTHHYSVRRKRDKVLCDKTLVIFLANLIRDVKIVSTEHDSHAWWTWAPPHAIQAQTIDPLLASVAEYLERPSAAGRAP